MMELNSDLSFSELFGTKRGSDHPLSPWEQLVSRHKLDNSDQELIHTIIAKAENTRNYTEVLMLLNYFPDQQTSPGLALLRRKAVDIFIGRWFDIKQGELSVALDLSYVCPDQASCIVSETGQSGLTHIWPQGIDYADYRFGPRQIRCLCGTRFRQDKTEVMNRGTWHWQTENNNSHTCKSCLQIVETGPENPIILPFLDQLTESHDYPPFQKSQKQVEKAAHQLMDESLQEALPSYQLPDLAELAEGACHKAIVAEAAKIASANEHVLQRLLRGGSSCKENTRIAQCNPRLEYEKLSQKYNSQKLAAVIGEDKWALILEPCLLHALERGSGDLSSREALRAQAILCLEEDFTVSV